MFPSSRTWCVAAALVCSAPFAQAEALTNYSAWTVDRRLPASFGDMGTFQGRPNTLGVSIAAGDYTAPVDRYDNTQGAGHTFTTPKRQLSVAYGSVYVPADWADSAAGPRYSVLSAFATASGAGTCTLGDDACTRYLNFALTNTTGNAFAAQGTAASFRTSAGITGGAPAWQFHNGAATLGSWNNLCIVLDENEVRHYANGRQIRNADISAVPAATKPDQINRLIVNTQARGASYDVRWSNLGVGSLAGAASAGGSGQTTLVSTPFANALEVRALDTDGAALPCVEITFTAPAAGASATLSATTVLTDMNGIARLTATANGVAGAYEVQAALPGGRVAATLALTNTAATPVPLSHTLSLLLAAMLAGMFWLQRRRLG